MTLKEKRERYESLRQKALGLTEKALAEDRQLDAAESRELDSLVEDAKQLHAQIERDQAGLKAMDLVDQAVAIHMGTAEGQTLGVKARDVMGHSWARAIKSALGGGLSGGEKTLTVPPAASIPMPSLATTPMGYAGAPLLGAVGITPWPATDGGRTIQFLRETTRTLAAAIVDPGATKPSSTLGLTLVESNAETVAHVCPAINRNDLQDFANMATFVVTEMVYGVQVALENAVLNANRTPPGMQGILHTAGTTAVPFSTDVPTTIMDAVTALTSLGYPATDVVLAPADWSKLALSKSTTGEFLFAGLPAASAAPRVLGLTAVVSPNLAAGEAIVTSLRQSVSIYEREHPVAEWGTQNTEFAQNQMTARVEGRFALVIPQPASIAVAALS
jgi:Phage capsid family